MEIELGAVTALRFPDGAPVRAASAVARFGDGWLIAQDDATHAGWLRTGAVTAVRMLPAVAGADVFDEASGTKHLKPDLEAACEVTVRGAPAVLLLGSGSTPERMRSTLVSLDRGTPRVVVADLSPLYASVAQALDVDPDQLNMEGACVVGGSVRWFQRGLPSAGLPTASVDLDLPTLLEAVAGGGDALAIGVGGLRSYDLGKVHDVGLAVTDAVCLGGQSLLVSAAAEDTPDPRDDGPVVGSALALLDGADVRDMAVLPYVHDRVAKVEGLGIVELEGARAEVLATVDADDPESPSLAVQLLVRW